MPDEAPFVIATRQKADQLFGTTLPLGVAASFAGEIRKVLGYDVIAILAASDQPFTISVREACDPEGVFVQTQVLVSALVGGVQQIRTRIRPTAPYMELVLANTGAVMTTLDFCAQGIPQP